MSIQIIDGFKLNSNTPIDSRIVTSGTASRNSMQYKYNGLRVFDTVQLISFVWINNNWIKDNESGGGVVFETGSTSGNNMLLKSITGGKFGNSIIYDNGINVGIDTNVPNTSFKLHVNGSVKATSYFGIGQNLTDLNASNINNGLLNVVRILPGTNNQILTTSGGVTTWMNPSQLTPGKVSISYRGSTTPATTDQFLTFVDNNDSQSVHINQFIKINNTNSQILASNHSNNNFSKPSYSFIGNKLVGIYLTNAYQVGISTGLNISGDITFREDNLNYFIRGKGFGGAIRFRSNSNVSQTSGLQIGEFRTNTTTFTPHIRIENNKTFFDQDINIATTKKIFLGTTANITNENSNIVINTGSTFTPTQFRAPNGTTALPGISFNSGSSWGMCKDNNKLSLVTNGSDRIEMISTGGFININGPTRIYSSLLVNSGLTVTGNTALNGTLIVSGNTTLNGGVKIGTSGTSIAAMYQGWVQFTYNVDATPRITTNDTRITGCSMNIDIAHSTASLLYGKLVASVKINIPNITGYNANNSKVIIQVTNKYTGGSSPYNNTFLSYTAQVNSVNTINVYITSLNPVGDPGVGGVEFFLSLHYL